MIARTQVLHASNPSSTWGEGRPGGDLSAFRQIPALGCDGYPMEAATPLHKPHVRTVGDRVAIDALVVEDEAAVRLVREREQAAEDPARTVVDAIEIGARVLDREQAAANADFVRTEFERASRQLEREFCDRARTVAELLGEKV